MIQSHYLEVDGAIGFVETCGSGIPLLCIHTAGQSGVQWRQVLRELPDLGYHVVVPDLPGHGRSDNAAAGPVVDLSEYADWLAQLTAELGLDRPLVVGCSIGGKIALDIAARGPIRPRAVVAMAADAYNPQLSVTGLQRSLEDAAAPSRADRTFFGTLSSVGRHLPQEQAAVVAAMHRREDPVISTSDLIGWRTHDLREQLADINCPVRLVAGGDDFWLDPTAVAWAASQIRGAEFELMDGVGHYPMEEIPEFPQQLHRWFGKLLAKERTA
ncbi:MAG: alpha/beta hydrolase [Frankiales bacterium]|jgi:pimeloyl-ACP methyl ester carboxylesterase|nr:alpha/beta hydrolase [Frankiales bacterium]